MISKKGLTLIEVVVSIAILSIISVVFLSVFVTGNKLVFNAGKKGRAEYISQKALENKLSGNAVTESGINIDTTPNYNITIDFGVQTVSVNGKLETLIYNKDNQRVNLATFVPNP